jgi:hypothetical protein
MYICKKDPMINSVRNAVLSILNKNNYGYISPSDFNLFALNSQMEIYEDYFSNYNKTINAENARASGTDYADVRKPIAETLENFLRTDYLSKISGSTFSMPSPATTGYSSFMILDIKCKPNVIKIGINTSVGTNQLIDGSAAFTLDGIYPGDVVSNITTGITSTVVSVVNSATILLEDNIFLLAGQAYGIISSSKIIEAEKVLNSNTILLLNSNLTNPTTEYPIYSLQGTALTFYPTSINNTGQVQATYFRYPKPPKWTYITLGGGEPIFDQSQSDYQDFELPLEDEYKLVTKILQYCGISIREAEVAQYAMAQEQQQTPTFSPQ